MILVDSNVIVAKLVQSHEHHLEAAPLFDDISHRLIIAAHSYAETFVTLTRRGGANPYGFDPNLVMAALTDLLSATTLVAMTPEQTVSAIKSFAEIGIGARLYDYLIGRTGMVHGAEAIITFNTGHLRTLFPAAHVLTPGEWLAQSFAASARFRG